MPTSFRFHPNYVFLSNKNVSNSWSLRVGEFDIQAENMSRRGFDLGIDEILVHPKYKKGKAYFDVAAILTKTIKFTSFVRPICLPSMSSSNPDEHAKISVELIGKLKHAYTFFLLR